MPDIDAVIVPIGGGGLISGVAFTIKSLNPNCKVYLGMGRNVQTLVRFVPEFPSIHPECNYIEGGWELHYSIPYSFIRQIFRSVLIRNCIM